MTTTLVDSNVLLDVATEDPTWGTCSTDALATAASEGVLAINPLIYAEVSIGFTTVEELDDALPSETYIRVPLPMKRGSSPARPSLPTGAERVPGHPHYQTSTSERTRPSAATGC